MIHLWLSYISYYRYLAWRINWTNVWSEILRRERREGRERREERREERKEGGGKGGGKKGGERDEGQEMSKQIESRKLKSPYPILHPPAPPQRDALLPNYIIISARWDDIFLKRYYTLYMLSIHNQIVNLQDLQLPPPPFTPLPLSFSYLDPRRPVRMSSSVSSS